MRSDVKKRVVYAVLVVLTVWPLVHIGLARRYEMSPWKLAGWGMYAEPRFDLVGMEVFYRQQGSDRFEQLTAPDPAVRTEATRFLERYKWLRQLAGPGRFARAIFEHHPRFAEVRVVVFRPVIDSDTGMVVLARREYDYGR